MNDESAVAGAQPAIGEPGRSISGEALDQLFRKARTQNGWQPRPVAEELLR